MTELPTPNNLVAKNANKTSYPILNEGNVLFGQATERMEMPFDISFDMFMYGIMIKTDDTYAEYDGAEYGDLAKHQDKYDNERELYKVLQMEAFNIHGLPILWHVSTFDTSYDRLFGEDNDMRVERVFSCVGYMPELPENHKNWNWFSTEGVDSFKLFINKEHFSVASVLEVSSDWTGDDTNPNGKYNTDFTETFTPSDSATGTIPTVQGFDNESFTDDFAITNPIDRSYIPKIGDIVKIGYNNIFYEVKDVTEEEEMFLQDKHTWMITIDKVMTVDHREVDNDDLNFDSGLEEVVLGADLFDQTDDIEEIKNSTEIVPDEFADGTSGKGRPNPLYEPDDDEEAPNDPFGGF